MHHPVSFLLVILYINHTGRVTMNVLLGATRDALHTMRDRSLDARPNRARETNSQG